MRLLEELRKSRHGTPTARHRRRWDLLAFWLVLAGPAAAVLLWATVRQQVGDLEARLVRDANATFSAPHPRPIHRGVAMPGTFGEAVARHLPPIQADADAAKRDEVARDVVRAIVAGERPLSALPPAYAAALERHGSDLDALLRGTRAERADLPLAREAYVPCDGADWSGFQHAALLAGVRIRRALAAGDAAGAAEDCMDGLALGRDAAIKGGLVPHMVGVAIVSRLVPPCADALAATDPAGRTAALAAVRTIRDAFPSVAETLRMEFLSLELQASAPVIDRSARARLVPAALAHVRGSEFGRTAWERLAIRDGWRGLRGVSDALLAAARTSKGAARDEAFAAANQASLRRLNPLAAIAFPRYDKFARRMDACMVRLDALALAAAAATHRYRTGRWPASVGELVVAALITTDESERTAAATFTLLGGGALELEVPLPTGDDKDARAIALRITRRRSAGSGLAR